MKKFFGCVMVGVMVLTMTLVPAFAEDSVLSTFSDVKEDEWFSNAIKNAVGNGLFTGYTDGTIKPLNSITRAEVATVLSKAFNASEGASIAEYHDVDKNEWYYSAMEKAVKMNILSGNGYGYLNPNSPITREETAAVISRAFGLTTTKEDSLNKFNDKDSVSEWAVPFVKALVENNVFSGDTYGNLTPKANITRAEFAQVMNNIVGKYIGEKGTVTESFENGVVVKVPDVVLKDLTVGGDVIVADGVGEGDFTLDNVKIDGRLIVRGGGVNSVKIINASSISGKVIIINRNSKTRLAVSKDCTVIEVNVDTSVILDGDFENVVINEVVDAEVKGTIKNMVLNSSANITGSGSVTNIDVKEENVTVSGDAKVENVVVSADNVTVNVDKAKVTVTEGVEGTKAGESSVNAGESTIVKIPELPAKTERTTGSSGRNSKVMKNIKYTITENGDIYTVTADSTNDSVTSFDNTYYVVDVSIGTAKKSATIYSGRDAIEFAKNIFNDNIDLVKLLKTIDGKHTDINNSKDYATYKQKIESAAQLMLDDPNDDDDKYDRLINAKNAAIANVGSEAAVKLEDVYNAYVGDDESNKAEYIKKEIVDLFVNIEDNPLYSEAVLYFLTNDFIQTLILND